MARTFTTRRWDDFHGHYRGTPMLEHIVYWMVRYFQRGLAMPNKPKISTAAQALQYAEQIITAAAAVSARSFQVLSTLKLDETTTYEQIKEAAAARVFGVKLYLGITTGSDAPVLNVKILRPQLEAVQEFGIPLLIHAETPWQDVDCLDREAECIPDIDWIVRRFTELLITVEHIGDRRMLDYVIHAPSRVGGGIAYQHCVYTMNDWRGGMLNNKLTCKPEVKRIADRDAIQKAIFTDRISKLFPGHDSAPHLIVDKIKGANGCFNAPGIGEAMVTLFDQNNCLDYLDQFHSVNGAQHYGLPLNQETMEFVSEPYSVPEVIAEEIGGIEPLFGGMTFPWRLVEE